MSFTISASATTLSAKARVANVARVAKRSVAQPMRPRGKSLVVRASVWSGMSTYMKKQCEAAAALEAKDADAGRQAWIDIDKQVPGARMAWMENATAMTQTWRSARCSTSEVSFTRPCTDVESARVGYSRDVLFVSIHLQQFVLVTFRSRRLVTRFGES